MLAAIIVLAALAGLAVTQAMCVRRDRRRFPAPGTLVGGLHFVSRGAGRPAVVFESGIANSSLSWSLIQPQVAGLVATYAYDRAGIGWSSQPAGRCSLEGISTALHHALHALHVPRPYILVGHSFGGLIVRYYAHRFPGELAALVLIDPATPEEWMNPDRRQRRRLGRAVFFTRAAGVLACFGIARFGLWLLLRRKQESPGPVSRFSRTLQRIRSEVRKIPAELMPVIQAHWSRPGFFWAMASYLKALPRCAAEAASCQIPAGLPVTVLSGAYQPPERLAEHAGIATRHVIAKGSGHFIHFDEPELVSTEIVRLVSH